MHEDLLRQPLKIGVVGLGMMGRAFAQICRQLPEARLAAVADISRSAAESVGSEYSVPFFVRPEDLIADPEIEAVIVATPETAHVQPVLNALALDKSVLVEKPLAHTAQASQAIVEAARTSRAVLLVGHVLRFTTHFAMAKEIVDEGRLGTVSYVQLRRLNGKSAQDRLQGRCSLPLFLGVHDYDFARWIVGSEPVRVYAQAQFGLLRAAGFPVEDSTVAMITFANGALAVVENGWILPQGHPSRSDGSFWIQGTQGRLDGELLLQGLRLATGENTTYVGTVFMPRVDGQIRGGFVHEVQHFVRCVRLGEAPLVSAKDGLIAVQMAEAVSESARTHRPVDLTRGQPDRP